MPTLALDDATLWYETTGEGPPLVLIHGAWSDADVWSAQVEHLSRNYQVITYDVRGHGRTGAGDRERYSVECFVDDLDRLLTHLDAERPLLCGVSLGSMIVREFLGRYPDRAAGAVLAGAIESMPPVEIPAWTKPYVSPVPALGASLSTVGSEATFRWLLRSIQLTTGTPWLSVDPATRSRAVETAGEIPPSQFRKIFSALYRYDPSEAPEVTTPTLVVYGQREAPSVKRQCERIASSVGNGSSAVIPDAAHLVNQDAPDAFNRTVETFFGSLPRGSPESTPAAGQAVGDGA